MKHLATVTSKGQITIPQEIRQRLGLNQGDQVSFEVLNGETVLKPHRSEVNPFKAFVGALGAFQTHEEINDWVDKLRNDEC